MVDKFSIRYDYARIAQRLRRVGTDSALSEQSSRASSRNSSGTAIEAKSAACLRRIVMKLDEGIRNISRRSFLGAAATTGAALGAENGDVRNGASGDPRARDAYRIRVDAASLEREAPQPVQVDNGDEALYVTRIGNFSKGLPHNDLGEAEPYAYDLFVQAMHTGTQAAMDQIPMGNPDPSNRLKLVNPCSGLAFGF